MSFLLRKKDKAPEPAIANVRASDFGTNEAARPGPLLYGIGKLAGTFISKLWARSASPIIKTFGEGFIEEEVVTGYNYSANFALFICMGPVDELRAIYANQERIWSGSVLRSSANAQGFVSVTTSLGVIDFYFGTSTQAPSGQMGALGPAPAYRWCCYAVCRRIFFGQSLSPPNLSFVLARRTDQLGASVDNLDRDALLPAVVYDLLTNPVYGAKLDSTLIDLAGFQAAAEQIISEDLGLSPLITTGGTMRQLMADLLQYANGAVYYEGGKLRFLLPRAEENPQAVEIGEADLVEEPSVTRPGWADTWNETRVKFTDREREWNSNVGTYSDLGNADAQGGLVQKEFDRRFVTREAVAAQLAAAIGKHAGVPLLSATLRLKSKHAGLQPNALLFLSYPRWGLAAYPLRVTRLSGGTVQEPAVTVEAVEDADHLSAIDYSPQADVTNPADIFEALPPEFRVATLTAAQRGDAADGLLVAAQRPSAMTIGGAVYAGWSVASGFTKMAEFAFFPVRVTLNRWRRYGAESYLLFDATAATDLDQEALTAYRDAGQVLYLVCGRRRQDLGNVIDEHEIEPSWNRVRPGGRFELVAARRWEIEMSTGEQGSTPLALEDPAGPEGQWPTVEAFIGPLNAFALLPTDALHFARPGGNDPDDVDQERLIRVVSRTPDEALELGAANTAEFDRGDASMHPDGTYTPDWGARAPNGEYVTEVLADAPSGYWRLDEMAGPAARDFSHVSGGDGVISAGGVAYQQASALALDEIDRAMAFDGATGQVDLENPPVAQIASGTIECWFKTSGPGSGRRALFAKRDAWGIFFDGATGQIGFWDFTTNTFRTSGNSFSDNQWHHAVLVFDSGVASGSTLWVDGVADTTGDCTVVDQLSSLGLAALVDAGTEHAAVTVDEAALYATALSAARIQAHYQAGKGLTW